jgi:NAD(P)-dependent dehydrogenase (short-subunit alcohol dehydrogenase family)
VSDLGGKVIAITGASRGLGRHIAQSCIDAGARVAVLARSSSALEETATELGDRCLALPTDVRDLASVQASFTRVAQHHGRLDALVNNAAFYYPVDIEKSDPAHIESHVSTNLMGATWCMRAAMPLLRDAGGGDIVNVSSVSVRLTPPMLSMYAATKAALETLSAALANELKDSRIRVTVLRLGAIAGGTASQRWDAQTETVFREKISSAPRVGGTPMSQQTLADMLIHILTLPLEARVNLVDVSPAI